MLGVSEATVRRRINDLLESRTIELSAIPDPVKVGLSTVAFLQLQIDLSQLDTVGEALTKYPEVSYVGICSGSCHLFVTVMFPSPLELSEFITAELAKIPGIIRTDTLMHLRYEKRAFGWLHRGFLSPSA